MTTLTRNITSRPSTRRGAGAALGGFSLIEVLIAVIVLGLGALSLAAVFAGAAKQQQSSADLTRATALTGSAEARLRSNFGALQPPGSLPSAYQHGQWYPMLSEDADTDIARYTLTSRPFIGPGINTTGWTFLVDDIDGYQFFPPSGNAEDEPDWVNISNFNTFATFVNASFVLPHRRIVPQSFSITLSTNSDLPAGWWSPGVGPSPRAHGTNPIPEAFGQVNQFQLKFSDLPPAVSNGITVNFGHNPGELARITTWSLPTLPPNPAISWIYSVTADPYQWLNDRLVSLNDRLIYEEDDRFPGERRPVMGYTVLFRTISNGAAAQMTVFPYTLAPLGVPNVSADEFVFAPPESFNAYTDEESLLREVPLRIGYDPETSQFFAEIDPSVNESEYRWALSTGQWLLMNSANGVGSGTPNDAGADEAVKVLTQRRNPQNGAVRAILSDSPRINNNSPVQDFTSVPAVANATIHVWAMPPIVESMTPDATQWQVRPVEPRTFQIVLK